MLKSQIKSIVQKSMKSLQKEVGGFNIPEIIVESPENGQFGDYSSNVAMRLAKILKRPPMETGQKIAEIIRNSKDGKIFSRVEVAPPGFINFFISEKYWQGQVKEILKLGNKFGRLNIGKNKKVMVEFISANPTGPLHLGNGRGGFFGDVLGNILKEAGYKVVKEYYINDYGSQVDKLGHSVLKDGQAEYYGDYIDYLHKKIKAKDYRKAGEQAVKIIMKEMIKKTAEKKMNIKFDNWFSEKTLHQKSEVKKILKWLEKKDLVYEKDGAVWFKSSQFGDEKDRVFRKKDGSYTYLAGDFAYHKNKFKRGFYKVINIWGADHHGDVARLKAAVEVLGYKGRLDIILMQMIRLIKDGQEVRMSKRKGVYVTVDELIDEVGADVVRFFSLTRSPDSHFDFDLNLAKEQSDKNPVYYVQYAYARISSILRKASARGGQKKAAGADYSLLVHPSELALIKEALKLPELIGEIADNYQAQKLTNYAINLARGLHSFYKNCKVLEEDENIRKARIDLIKAVQSVLKKTLDLIGVKAPEKM